MHPIHTSPPRPTFQYESPVNYNSKNPLICQNFSLYILQRPRAVEHREEQTHKSLERFIKIIAHCAPMAATKMDTVDSVCYMANG